jgi:phytoene synthase
MTRKTSFYYSFLVLPKAKRDVIVAVWDFCRAVDDAVDLEPDPHRARVALEGWRREVGRVFEGTPETAQGRALQRLAAPFSLPRGEFDALIDGVGMDIAPQRFETFADLEPYCHRVASSVGLICAEIFGYRDPVVREYARDLGVALQLTNIVRDVGVDFRQGRLYLPLADLAEHGVTEDDIAREVAAAGRGVTNPRVASLLAAEAARAREFFARAERELPEAERRAVLAAEIMRAIYEETLDRIEARGFDVFSRVVKLHRVTQARLAARVLWSTPRG